MGNSHKGPLLLSAEDVRIRFRLRGKELTAVRGASLEVYGGELDTASGVLTVTYDCVDLGDLGWTVNTSYTNPLYRASIPGWKTGSINNGVSSDYAPTTDPFNRMPDLHWKTAATNTVISVRDSRCETAAEFKAAVTGVQFVFELATPVTIQLTEAEVRRVAKQIGQQVVTVKPEARMRTDWTAADIPRQSEMAAYLGAVEAIREKVREYRPDAALPESMRNLGFNEANQIEALLSAAEDVVTKVMLSYRGYSGRLQAGGGVLP